MTVELAQLQRMVTGLVDALRENLPDGQRGELRDQWTAAQAAKRTAATFETWLDDQLEQAAVAWVLGCVFVRFCEDNGLVDGLWIGGPDSAAEAADRATAYRTENFRTNERDWIRLAFRHLAGLSGTKDIFDAHNPVWRFDIPGDAAMRLLDQFRRGVGVGMLTDPALDTRFLGDLYQDLSAHAKKTYALLQTPEFVEEFILDRAFEPAVAEFGLSDTKVIDPACGSGHFVLGAFHRLIRKWQDARPAADIRELTQTALDQVTGVDINPFAIAIARFRLLVAALQVCELSSLETSPDFRMRLAAGDSLLRWGDGRSRHQGDMLALLSGDEVFSYATEDAERLKDYLKPEHYTVVLANPPYITVKDKALNQTYRELYSACSGKYALTVPFAERLFNLARKGDHDGYGAGWVGQITSNSFMKREFGKKLIEDFFAKVAELQEVIDASGVRIPGHGTPTVVLIGRNRWPSARYSQPIRTVMGIRGDPGNSNDPANDHVWPAIVGQIDTSPSESEWITVADIDRDRLSTYPWSLSGGGAGALRELIESDRRQLESLTALLGFVAITAEDDAFLLPSTAVARYRIESSRPMVEGDAVRDFLIRPSATTIFPYGIDLATLDLAQLPGTKRVMWPNRRVMERRKRFGTLIEDIPTLRWFEFGELYREKLRAPLSIAFAGVSTHNHFVLDRGGKVFNRWAPVIKLPAEASEDEHLRLLGVLNSSTACFWLKQVSHNKGEGGGARVDAGYAAMGSEDWKNHYEFTGTKLKEFPLPAAYPVERARELDRLAQELAAVTPAAVAAAGVPTREALDTAEQRYQHIRARMIAVQEELDWEVYRHYGLVDDDLTTDEPPELALGERAFEIVLARSGAETEWFSRHGSTPITELPGHWSDEYRALVEKRIALIEADRNIGLIERPECKRRWQTDGWDAMRTAALRDWLLDRLEAPELWGEATPLTVAQLADRVRHDEDFAGVLTLWMGNDQYDPAQALAKLVADEHVPYLPAQRYKPSGLRKRVQWERTWALQRREDAGEQVDIPVPPKYGSGDFRKTSYWRNRGKLDVPKERFVSYPDASPDVDGSLLLGWAGWDHVRQAQALAGLYNTRQEQQWPRERLLPLLAGLAELEPWLHQWHHEPTDDFNGFSPAGYVTDFLDAELSTLDADRATLDHLRGLA